MMHAISWQCGHEAGITVTLPKPMTSGAKSDGRFGKQDPAGGRLKYHYPNVENGLRLRCCWTNACQSCALKHRCTTGKERRITR